MSQSSLMLLRIGLTLYWLALFTATHWPISKPPIEIDFAIGTDKFFHVLAFGLLACLAFGAKLTSKLRYTLYLLLAYACLDEITQAFVPLRTVDWYDLLANIIGIGIVALVWLPVAMKNKTTDAHEQPEYN